MPQIANQDYNVVKSAYATIDADAAALGMLAGHIARGTIFDVIIEYIPGGYAKIVSLYVDEDTNEAFASCLEAEDGVSSIMHIKYNSIQYEGLAAVQVACELTAQLPALETDASGYLLDGTSGNYLCVDGKLVSVIASDDDKIESLSVSDVQAGDDITWVNVPFDELQKLVGVDIG